LVMLATPGPLPHYLGWSAETMSPAFAAHMHDVGPPTYLMHTFPLPFVRYRKLFTDGATLVVPPTRHVSATSIDPRAKIRSRMHWWIAEQEAKGIDPAASALLLNATGHVTETSAANFLVVRA